MTEEKKQKMVDSLLAFNVSKKISDKIGVKLTPLETYLGNAMEEAI